MYFAYALLLNSILLSSAKWVLDSLDAPSGLRTLAVQGVATVIASIIGLRSARLVQAIPLLTELWSVWAFWLAYLWLSHSSSDAYSNLKFGHAIGTLFISLSTVTIILVADHNRFHAAFKFAAVGTSAAMLIALFASPTIFLYNGYIERLTITGVNPIWLARAFAISSLVLVLWSNGKIWIRIVGVALFVAGILTTGSRGPLISLFAVSLFALVAAQNVHHKRKAFFAFALFSIGIALVIGWPLFGDKIEEYLDRDSQKSAFTESGRDSLFGEAVSEFIQSPFIGVGLGMYGRKSHSISLTSENGLVIAYPHNIVLEVLSELGLVGVVIFFILLMPGRWMANWSNAYVPFFWLCLLFAMTSGDMTANSGVFLFSWMSRIYERQKKGSKRNAVPTESNASREKAR